MIQSVRSAIVRTSTTPTPPPGAVKDASATKTSSTVDGRISWVKRDTDLRKYTSIMIAPVSIYDGADIDWGNTGPADRTEIANYLQTAYTKAIGRSMRIVKTPGPNALLLKMQLAAFRSGEDGIVTQYRCLQSCSPQSKREGPDRMTDHRNPKAVAARARSRRFQLLLAATAGVAIATVPLVASAQPAKRPNIVMLMTDDTGWNDFGAYSNGGAALGHPTPNVDRIAEEGAVFTDWYGQASCTAGRASFITGRIPIRSALSIVVAPGDANGITSATPTIAQFFQKNGYTTYFSGKWHLGDKPENYPIAVGFDEMKNFAAYYAGVYAYDNTTKWFHPWFPSYNPEFNKMYDDIVNLDEWEGVAGQPAKDVGRITYDSLATFDIRQSDSAIDYIKRHAHDTKPFFMDVNYIKMHNPTNAAPAFAGKSHLGDYSDSLMELDADIGRVMDEIRAEAPDTIVIVTADNGAWLDAYPDAGTTPFRGEKGSPFEGGWRVPGLMWWPGHIPARSHYGEMMSHIDAWATLAGMVGLTPPPHEWFGNDGKPIYFDSVDNSAYILGKAQHSARDSWVYIDGENFEGVRADIGGDPQEPWVHVAWKYLYTAKDSWLGPTQNLGSIGAVYNLTMDPYEKYDMTFNGAAPTRGETTSPGRYAGQDNGWVMALAGPVIVAFDKSIMQFPNIRRFVGGGSNDLVPDLQHPDNPVPLLKQQIIDGKEPHPVGGGAD